MKGSNILCVSQASTAICMSHMDHIHSSSPSSSSDSPSIHYGGRTIDRHNPIIRDTRRPTLSAPCSSSPRAAVNPTSYHQLQKKTKKVISSEQKRKTTVSSAGSVSSFIFTSKLLTVDRKQQDRTVTVSNKENDATTDKITELITPPGSSRYLLSETDKINGLSDLPDPAVDLQVPVAVAVAVHQDDTNLVPPPSSPSRFKTNQVVVLRVSLHCKGCEGKVRKHISRMEGVTSFNIDFKAKKVTVVGDVTPLSVLASVSKVKSAQLWTSTAPLDGNKR